MTVDAEPPPEDEPQHATPNAETPPEDDGWSDPDAEPLPEDEPKGTTPDAEPLPEDEPKDTTPDAESPPEDEPKDTTPDAESPPEDDGWSDGDAETPPEDDPKEATPDAETRLDDATSDSEPPPEDDGWSDGEAEIQPENEPKDTTPDSEPLPETPPEDTTSDSEPPPEDDGWSDGEAEIQPENEPKDTTPDSEPLPETPPEDTTSDSESPPEDDGWSDGEAEIQPENEPKDTTPDAETPPDDHKPDVQAEDDGWSNGEADPGTPDARPRRQEGVGDIDPDPDAYLDGDGYGRPSDESMDRANAAALVDLQKDLDRARANNDIDFERSTVEAMSSVEVQEAIRADPQGYLDGIDRGGSSSHDDGDRVKFSFVEREPIVSRFQETPEGRLPDAWETLTGERAVHQLNLYDGRDIGQPVESAGMPTDASQALREDLLKGVNRFFRAETSALGEREMTYLWNCSACVKAVDSRLTGFEPDAYVGFIADPPDGAFASRKTDSVFESTLQEEWGRAIVSGSTADVEQSFRDLGPGSRGVLVCNGHVANVLNRDGKILVLDGQSGESCALREYKMLVTGYIRTYP